MRRFLLFVPAMLAPALVVSVLLVGSTLPALAEITTPWPSPVYMDTAADPNIIRIADDGEGGAIVAWNELRESLHYIQFMR
ncbi:MAG: hypothetical protein KAY32_15335, partial [Candidatus Eisenbacteria sp.]|nr:hypothetical protein [Candidatus Eisenbacteria bacterium]